MYSSVDLISDIDAGIRHFFKVASELRNAAGKKASQLEFERSLRANALNVLGQQAKDSVYVSNSAGIWVADLVNTEVSLNNLLYLIFQWKFIGRKKDPDFTEYLLVARKTPSTRQDPTFTLTKIIAYITRLFAGIMYLDNPTRENLREEQKIEEIFILFGLIYKFLDELDELVWDQRILRFKDVLQDLKSEVSWFIDDSRQAPTSDVGKVIDWILKELTDQAARVMSNFEREIEKKEVELTAMGLAGKATLCESNDYLAMLESMMLRLNLTYHTSIRDRLTRSVPRLTTLDKKPMISVLHRHWLPTHDLSTFENHLQQLLREFETCFSRFSKAQLALDRFREQKDALSIDNFHVLNWCDNYLLHRIEMLSFDLLVLKYTARTIKTLLPSDIEYFRQDLERMMQLLIACKIRRFHLLNLPNTLSGFELNLLMSADRLNFSRLIEKKYLSYPFVQAAVLLVHGRMQHEFDLIQHTKLTELEREIKIRRYIDGMNMTIWDLFQENRTRVTHSTMEADCLGQYTLEYFLVTWNFFRTKHFNNPLSNNFYTQAYNWASSLPNGCTYQFLMDFYNQKPTTAEALVAFMTRACEALNQQRRSLQEGKGLSPKIAAMLGHECRELLVVAHQLELAKTQIYSELKELLTLLNQESLAFVKNEEGVFLSEAFLTRQELKALGDVLETKKVTKSSGGPKPKATQNKKPAAVPEKPKRPSVTCTLENVTAFYENDQDAILQFFQDLETSNDAKCRGYGILGTLEWILDHYTPEQRKTIRSKFKSYENTVQNNSRYAQKDKSDFENQKKRCDALRLKYRDLSAVISVSKDIFFPDTVTVQAPPPSTQASKKKKRKPKQNRKTVVTVTSELETDPTYELWVPPAVQRFRHLGFPPDTIFDLGNLNYQFTDCEQNVLSRLREEGLRCLLQGGSVRALALQKNFPKITYRDKDFIVFSDSKTLITVLEKNRETLGYIEARPEKDYGGYTIKFSNKLDNGEYETQEIRAVTTSLSELAAGYSLKEAFYYCPYDHLFFDPNRVFPAFLDTFTFHIGQKPEFSYKYRMQQIFEACYQTAKLRSFHVPAKLDPLLSKTLIWSAQTLKIHEEPPHSVKWLDKFFLQSFGGLSALMLKDAQVLGCFFPMHHACPDFVIQVATKMDQFLQHHCKPGTTFMTVDQTILNKWRACFMGELYFGLFAEMYGFHFRTPDDFRRDLTQFLAKQPFRTHEFFESLVELWTQQVSNPYFDLIAWLKPRDKSKLKREVPAFIPQSTYKDEEEGPKPGAGLG